MQEGTKGTSPGQELIMTLIPENVQGPDRVVSPLRRIFYHQASFQTYQDKWWEAYPAPKKEVERVEGSDKLLRFRLDAGDGEDRQILSGIAQFYPNEQELVGKKLQIVANLKPRKMMKKYVSQGMILSAEHGDQLTVLTVDPSVPNGSIIG